MHPTTPPLPRRRATEARRGLMHPEDVDRLASLGDKLDAYPDYADLPLSLATPYARYYRNADQTAIVNNTETTVLYDTLDFKSGTPFSLAAGVFTLLAGYDGCWAIEAQVFWGSGGVLERRYALVRKNGAGTRQGQNLLNSFGSTPVADLVPLVAGDTVDVRALQLSGGNLDILGGATLTVVTFRFVGV